MCACVRARARVCVWVCVCMSACMCCRIVPDSSCLAVGSTGRYQKLVNSLCCHSEFHNTEYCPCIAMCITNSMVDVTTSSLTDSIWYNFIYITSIQYMLSVEYHDIQ